MMGLGYDDKFEQMKRLKEEPEYLGDFSHERTKEVYGMQMNDYQDMAKETAVYDEPLYPIASLMVEAGELADIFIKPWLRGDVEDIDLQEVKAEAGDVLWMLSNLLTDMGLSLEEVARYNLAKLRDRQERGVIAGKGGNR